MWRLVSVYTEVDQKDVSDGGDKDDQEEDPPPLPVGWYSTMDKANDEEYFYTKEGVVQWDRPTNQHGEKRRL